MEWPHDPDGEEGSEEGRVYGLAIFAKKIDPETDFPLSFEDLAEDVGHHPIRIDSDRVVPAADIIDTVETETVETFTEFHRVLGDAMRNNGYRFYDHAVELSE